MLRPDSTGELRVLPRPPVLFWGKVGPEKGKEERGKVKRGGRGGKWRGGVEKGKGMGEESKGEREGERKGRGGRRTSAA